MTYIQSVFEEEWHMDMYTLQFYFNSEMCLVVIKVMAIAWWVIVLVQLVNASKVSYRIPLPLTEDCKFMIINYGKNGCRC